MKAGEQDKSSKSPANNIEVKSPSLFIKSWGGVWREWLSLAFVFLTLSTAVYSIEKVEWVSPQPALKLTLLLSVLGTWGLAKSKLPAAAKHACILVLGPVVTIWQLSFLVVPQPWWQALDVKPNESTTYFTTFLILVTWLIGYISTWFMVQRRNAWVTVAMGAVMVLVNLNNLPPREYYRFFPIYVLAAILLLGQSNVAEHLRQLKQYGQRYSRRGLIYYASVVIVFSVLVASSALFLPEIQLNPDSSISKKISWNNSEEHWLNIFAAVTAKREVLPSVKQSELFFTDAPYYEETVQFVVSSDKVKYWRTHRYDSYVSWGWTATDALNSVLYAEGERVASELLKRQEFTYTVNNKLKTDVLLMAGEFKTASLPVVLQGFASQLVPARPEDRTLDVISVIAPQMLPPNETYTVTVWLTQATPAELSRAGTDYDGWVTEHYLQLPESLPERVKELSRQITREAKTPFQKAIEIKDFLQRFTYNIAFNTPPTDVDAVDYFLFDKKAGDCTYFASAMAVMLRSVDVPARVSSGYRLVEKNNGHYVLRARDYHARAEVFFPGYGWIEFEATPGVPGLSYEEDIGFEETTNVTSLNNTDSSNNSNSLKYGNLFFIDSFGNQFFIDRLDKDGNPIIVDKKGNRVFLIGWDEYDNPILSSNPPIENLIPLSPSFNTTPVLSANKTVAVSPNATPALSPNTTALSPNTTSALSQNKTTSALSPNTTPLSSPEGNIISPGEAFAEMPPSNPAVLPLIGFISVIVFVLGVAGLLFYQLRVSQVLRVADAWRVYARMCMLASLGKSGPRPIETPLEYGFRLALAFPAQSQTISNITQIYSESRFSQQKDLDQARKLELEKSWLQLYPTLVKRILRF